ncbi:MAG: hypothetical protein ACYDH8_00470 [Syntrophales bacterium]
MFTIKKQMIGTLLLVLLTCYSSISTLWRNFSSYCEAPETDPVTVHEERIIALKEFMPASGEVGYITSIANDKIFTAERTFANVEFLAQFVLTQYTLAPLVVRNSPFYPLVVGNFIDGSPAAGFLEENGLTPLRDLGDGLIIYRGEKKP